MPAKTAEVKQEPQNGSRVGITTRDHRVSALSLRKYSRARGRIDLMGDLSSAFYSASK